jgi:hypothetical protein
MVNVWASIWRTSSLGIDNTPIRTCHSLFTAGDARSSKFRDEDWKKLLPLTVTVVSSPWIRRWGSTLVTTG